MEASASNGSQIPKSLSLDKLCLQLMKSYPGFSPLCNLCIKVFRGRTEYGEYKAHLELLSTLEESAKRGCRLCNLISECFREHVQGKAISCVNLRYRIEDFQNLRFESLSTEFYCDINCDHVKGKPHRHVGLLQVLKHDSIALYFDFGTKYCGQHAVRSK